MEAKRRPARGQEKKWRRLVKGQSAALKCWLHRLIRPVSSAPILAALLVALLVLGILVALYAAFPALHPGYWSGVHVELTGFLFDLLFFGVAVEIIREWRAKKQTVARYQEEIQDFKRWSTDEGRLRIAGAVRRLVKMGKTKIDFTGMTLTDFSFRVNDIRSISGSVFYEGEWGTLSSRESVHLENVDFSFVNCSDVVFSAFDPFHGLGIFEPPVKIKDCSFQKSNLSHAIFNGASLEWTDEPPDRIEEETENPDGSMSPVQNVFPAFDRAELTGTSFVNARFKRADFRKAENVLEADFSGATGLEDCVFDDDEIKASVLRQVKSQN